MKRPCAPESTLMIFHDDSSLVVARRFADLIAARGGAVRFMQFAAHAGAPEKLSARQLEQGLGPWRVDRFATGIEACDEAYLSLFPAVASAKFPVLFRQLWARRGWRFGMERPSFVALFPGLELTCGRGYEIRRFADIVCLPTQRDVEDYASRALPGRPARQRVVRFHPCLMRCARGGPSGRRRLVFFSQSVAPNTLAGRRDIARLLTDTARAHPDVEVVVKLRHRTDENRAHTHVERYDYQTLIGALDPPGNLRFSDESADSALAGASIALTCSSTSGLEALARGVPTMFFVDHVDAEADPLNAAMRDVLAGGGPVARREAVIALSPPAVAPGWLDAVTSSQRDLDAVFAAIESSAAEPIGRTSPWRARLGRASVEVDLLMKGMLRDVLSRRSG